MIKLNFELVKEINVKSACILNVSVVRIDLQYRNRTYQTKCTRTVATGE